MSRIFASESACVRLVSAWAMERNLEWTERVYLKVDEATICKEEMVRVA